MNFFSGIIVGIIVATVGFAGVAKILDSGVSTVKQISTQVTR
jgi:hypothetical protein